MQFIQPDAIREGLKESRVISYRYMINVNGNVSYEALRFTGVRHPEDRDDHIVHTVSAEVFRKRSGDLLQYEAADLMAVVVVDALELVRVEQEAASGA